MNLKIKMPDLATTEGSTITILNWLVEVGDEIKRGQPLVEVETDKATMEIESIASGKLKEIHVEQNQEVDVGAFIATLEVDRPAPAPAPSPSPSPAPEQQATDPGKKVVSPPEKSGGMFAKKRKEASGDQPD